MKKMIALFTAVVFALTLGTAFAEVKTATTGTATAKVAKKSKKAKKAVAAPVSKATATK
jgi:hypothetical protein